MDSVIWIVAVCVYTAFFLVQLIINFVNFFRTGKISKMTFNPPTKEEVQTTISDSNDDYFLALQSLISFHESELQKLKEISKKKE